METAKNISAAINNLIMKNNDIHQKYLDLAFETKIITLRGLLRKLAEKRRIFSMQLAVGLKDFDISSEVDYDGSLMGALERGWLNLKTSVSMETDESLLAECVRAETATLEEYENTIKQEGLSEKLVTVLQQHMEETEASLRKLHSIEDLS